MRVVSSVSPSTIHLAYSKSSNPSSKKDIRFLQFSNLSLNLPNKLTKHIHLLLDLNRTATPYNLHAPSYKPITELDILRHPSPSWLDVSLLTNFLIPPESIFVPSTLNTNHLPQKSDLSFFPDLWYQPHARALRQYLCASSTPFIISPTPQTI